LSSGRCEDGGEDIGRPEGKRRGKGNGRRENNWRYKCVGLGSIKNTLRYMFFRHRKGIYVSLRDGRLKTFFAFQNRRFRNPLAPALALEPGTMHKVMAFSEANDLKYDEEYDKTRSAVQVPDIDAARRRARSEASAFREATRVQDPSMWGTTGCLVTGVLQTPPPRDHAPAFEPDHGFLACKHYLEHMCRSRSVPDCDFFINTYDQLLLRRDMHSPNRDILDHDEGRSPILANGKEDEQTGIAPYKSSRMCPIVSFCTGKDYLDIPFVFPDDIIREFRMFDVPKCSNPYLDSDKYILDWGAKRATAVFRGTATGSGWTPDDNPRVRLAYISRLLLAATEQQTKEDNISRRLTRPSSKALRTQSPLSSQTKLHPPLLDVQLTGEEHVRFKKSRRERFVSFKTPEETGAMQRPDLALSNVAQSEYKYVVYVEGNVAAYRLCNMFAMGSVVIYVESEFIPWIYPLLRDRVNCIKVANVDEVPRAILWCR